MKRRKYHLPPPASPAYKTGQVLTFIPSKDDPKPEEMVEATPVGPELLVLTFKPEPATVTVKASDADTVKLQAHDECARFAEFFLALINCKRVRDKDEDNETLNVRRWKDVLANPIAWGPLTAFLIRSGLACSYTNMGPVLQVGRGRLASYWMDAFYSCDAVRVAAEFFIHTAHGNLF
jgi:hypothetical protein